MNESLESAVLEKFRRVIAATDQIPTDEQLQILKISKKKIKIFYLWKDRFLKQKM